VFLVPNSVILSRAKGIKSKSALPSSQSGLRENPEDRRQVCGDDVLCPQFVIKYFLENL
jgi:hypothetical protein